MGVKGKMKATAVAEEETVGDVLSTMRKLVVKGMSLDIVDKLAKEISDYKLAIETAAGELRVLGEEEKPCALVRDPFPFISLFPHLSLSFSPFFFFCFTSYPLFLLISSFFFFSRSPRRTPTL
jgi:hypothetical protein